MHHVFAGGSGIPVNMLTRQSTAGPSYQACAQAFARSLTSTSTREAPYGVKESRQSFGLHLGERKRQLREAVQTGKGAVVQNDDFKKLLDADKIAGRPRESRNNNGLDPTTEKRARNLGRKPSIHKLQAVFGDVLPRRPSRALKYPSQIKKFVASQLEGAQPPASPRLLPRDVTDPYYTADKFKRFVTQHRVNGVLGIKNTQEAINIVAHAARQAQNVVVWNQCLAVVGQEGMFERQYRLFNLMKSNGIKPSTRTYTILLSSYAHSKTKLESRALSRATLIFDNAVKHLRQLVKSPTTTPADTGYETSGLAEEGDYEVPGRHRRFVPPDVADVAPYNAYLTFCEKNGLWAEMQRVFLSLDRTGPLSPDSATYTVMLQAVAAAPPATPGHEDTAMTITARSLWDQAVRQFRTVDESLSQKAQSQRRIDFMLANRAIASLVKGRWEDQKYALDMIPRLYNLSLPGQSATMPQPPPSLAMASLPVLPLNVKSATSIISLTSGAKKHDLASHFVHLFLADPQVMQEADLAFFCLSITALSEHRDVDGILHILESYQPPSTGKDGWPLSAWHSMLNATRWAKDWRSALLIFRKMTQIPPGVEHRRETAPERKIIPYKKPSDARGVRWQETDPRRPDAESMSLLLKTAWQSSAEITLQALRVFAHFPSAFWTRLPGPNAEERNQVHRMREDMQNDAARNGELIAADQLPHALRLSLLTDQVTDVEKLTTSQRKVLQWTFILFEDVERAIERVFAQCKIEDDEREELSELRGGLAKLLLKWESVNTSDGIRYNS